MNKKRLIILTGPTAVGKTDLSIKLAQKYNFEIISADSMQIYKKMNIGTAKISTKEMQGIKHYLIDELDPKIEFNVFEFQKKAKKAIEEIYAKGKIPLVVGGTGFYIQALLYDVDFTPSENDKQYRRALENIAKTSNGKEILYSLLSQIDEKASVEIHKHNVKRVIRALEFYQENGKSIIEHNEGQRQKEAVFDFSYIVLTDNRQALYDRINKRVDLMIEDGLVEEVRGLLDEGYTLDNISMQGLGYKEIVAYLNGKISLEQAIEILKRDTRHFAKRQLTWFRRERDVIMLSKADFSQSELLERVEGIIEKNV